MGGATSGIELYKGARGVPIPLLFLVLFLVGQERGILSGHTTITMREEELSGLLRLRVWRTKDGSEGGIFEGAVGYQISRVLSNVFHLAFAAVRKGGVERFPDFVSDFFTEFFEDA